MVAVLTETLIDEVVEKVFKRGRLDTLTETLRKYAAEILSDTIELWLADMRKKVVQGFGRFKKAKGDITAELADWSEIAEAGERNIRFPMLDIFQETAEGVKRVTALKGTFDITNPRVLEKVDTITTKLISNVTDETRKAIREAIRRGYEQGRGVYETSKLIRPLIGLNSRQMLATENFRNKLYATMPTATSRQVAVIDKKVEQYTKQAHRYRATMIAQTEGVRAVSEATLQMYVENGVTEVVWSASATACDVCGPKDGHRFKLHEAEGMIPVHPWCECMLVYDKPKKKLEETNPKKGTEVKMESDEIKSSSNLDGGINASYILSNDFKGVFKPAAGEKRDLREAIKGGTYYKREIAAYKVDQALGFDIVPPTVVRKVKGKIGSIQEFKEGAKELYILGPKDLYKARKANVDEIGVFDFIIGSTDRHRGNAMFVKGKGKIKDKVWAIDNGLAFSDYSKIKPIYNKIEERISSYAFLETEGKAISLGLKKKITSFIKKEQVIRMELKDLLTKGELDGVFMRAKTLSRLEKLPKYHVSLGKYKGKEVTVIFKRVI